MVEEFKAVYEIFDSAESELWLLLNKAVGRKFKFVNDEGLNYEIYIEYFRGFDKVGVVQYFNEQGECVNDEWSIADLYDTIKNSTEIK